ncbi:MAG: hypothetical protein IM624_04005 [Phenylobacterium sp.]|uniref:hypothetical protein n=1 Tax=Phenylobacterium sp. TaxID=1871053 RepID=UPI0025E9AC50|nr:hypothetical protein [Phenylobacterium sp.]MCA6298346.1 hypothetical protein [Phenylobacterium sp.]
MTKRRRASPTPPQGPDTALRVPTGADEAPARALARTLIDPGARHALAAAEFAVKPLGDLTAPGVGDFQRAMDLALDRAGDRAAARKMLAAQAVALDSVFCELTRRAGANLGTYPEAVDRYLRLAMKAQANARATLEAIHRLSEPPPAPPRYVSVRDGGQAVIADQFHHHASAPVLEDQSHAPRTIVQGPAMPSEDKEGLTLPSPSGEGPG